MEREAPLLARRIPKDTIVPGRAYIIHARNGGVGIAVLHGGRLGYALHRVKFDRHDLFVEWDWDEGPPFGTAIPLAELPEAPPVSVSELEAWCRDRIEPSAREDVVLAWLSDREVEHRAEIRAAWDVVLPPGFGSRLK
ncbi:MAG: hypothetical protein ACOZNI_30715 [Myxococcota bacterium]